MDGLDLVPMVTSGQRFTWDETPWAWDKGFGKQSDPQFNVVAIDYGIKRNILRCLADAGCRVTVVPANATAEEVLRHKPDGVFLSNGPGDPAATGEYAVPTIRKLVETGLPIFGITHPVIVRRGGRGGGPPGAPGAAAAEPHGLRQPAVALGNATSYSLLVYGP